MDREDREGRDRMRGKEGDWEEGGEKKGRGKRGKGKKQETREDGQEGNAWDLEDGE